MIDGIPRQKLNRDPDGTAQGQPAELGQENRNAEFDRNGNQHGDQRGDEGAVDRGRRSVLILWRAPGVREQEADAEFAERRQGAKEQGDHNSEEEHQNENRRAERQQAEAVVREFEPTERARAVDRRTMGGAGGLQCGCGHRRSSASLWKREAGTHPRGRVPAGRLTPNSA